MELISWQLYKHLGLLKWLTLIDPLRTFVKNIIVLLSRAGSFLIIRKNIWFFELRLNDLDLIRVLDLRQMNLLRIIEQIQVNCFSIHRSFGYNFFDLCYLTVAWPLTKFPIFVKLLCVEDFVL